MTGLVDKVESELRSALAEGKYHAGEALPSRRLLAERFGVGERTVRAAIARLEASGVVSVRRRVGAVVTTRAQMRHRRLVLDVRSEDYGSCSGSMFSLGVRRTVEKAGVRYRDIQLSYRHETGVDVSALEEVLAEKPDFVLIRAPQNRLREVCDCVAAKGPPFATVACGTVSNPTCVGSIGYDATDAIEEFVEDCKRASVRSVLQFDYGPGSYIDAQKKLEAVGISVERLSLTSGSQYEDLDELVKDAANIMKRRLRAGPLPELLLIIDDFIASGAVTTLYREGFRIPSDIKVVAYANLRSGFSFLHTMACFEMDPYQEGVNCSRSVLKYLKTGVFTPYAACPVYRRGISFPVRSQFKMRTDSRG